MKQVPPHVLKAFAVSSVMGAMLVSVKSPKPRLITLRLQIDNALRVFNKKAGRKTYYAVSDKIQEIWIKLAEKHNNTLEDDEIEVFLEMVANLIPKDHYKQFLALNTFNTSHTLRDSKKSALLVSVMSLDSKLNDAFGSRSTATRESIGEILSKRIAPKKVKTIRDKSSKIDKVKTISKSKQKEADRKLSSRNFLRDRIAKAKDNK